MEPGVNYRLCGGIFFSLIVHASEKNLTGRQRAGGEQAAFKESDIFGDLIKIAYPAFTAPAAGRSLATYASNYKKCEISANPLFPITDKDLINEFDAAIKTNYLESIKAMDIFASRYINIQLKSRWLVCALMELIRYDNEIDDTDLFYIDADGHPVSKAELLNMKSFVLQPFLLGVWHYIITHRADNTIGKNTFSEFHTKTGESNSGWAFTSDIGRKAYNTIDVNILESGYAAFSGLEEMSNTSEVCSSENAAGNDSITVETMQTSSPARRFSAYLNALHGKYNTVKTLLYNDVPRPFYDFYICNNVRYRTRVSSRTYQIKCIKNATADILADCSNYLLLTGSGGMGKSMMMRHLLLDSVQRYDELQKLPIFVSLKDYSDEYSDLTDFIYDTFKNLDKTQSQNTLIEILDSGSGLLLFDGLDEINSDNRSRFERYFEMFVDRYPHNLFIVSTRPAGTLTSIKRFSELWLDPFSKEQALALIDKLDFRPDLPRIKEKFRQELDEKLYYSHRGFTANPLLLTIMLMTFEQFAEVPSKMHIFYHEAYTVLSQKHDASKGGFKRLLDTGVTASRFSDYFAEFCARTYRDEKYEFSEREFDDYYGRLYEPRKDNNSATSEQFCHDLVSNLCLMFYESDTYRFTHRSFQEYFCALYFSKQKDKYLSRIGELFEKKRVRTYGDITFNMLYDMIPEKVEEYIFEPFLSDLFARCDAEDGYWTFLREMYPALSYQDGDTNDVSILTPQSFLYDFIIRIHNLREYIDDEKMPHVDDFVIREWVYLDEEWVDEDADEDAEPLSGLIEKDDLPWEYVSEYGDPEIVGRTYEIDIDSLLSEPELYSKIIEQFEKPEFPLMAEFSRVRNYLQEIINKKSPAGDDLFDLFQ